MRPWILKQGCSDVKGTIDMIPSVYIRCTAAHTRTSMARNFLRQQMKCSYLVIPKT